MAQAGAAVVPREEKTLIAEVVHDLEVEVGLVASFNRPDGNATGASVFTTELLPKRLEMLHEALGSTQTIGFLQNTGATSADLDSKIAMEASAGARPSTSTAIRRQRAHIRPRQARAAGRATSAGKRQSIRRRMATMTEAADRSG
jgi:hypothetical protein